MVIASDIILYPRRRRWANAFLGEKGTMQVVTGKTFTIIEKLRITNKIYGWQLWCPSCCKSVAGGNKKHSNLQEVLGGRLGRRSQGFLCRQSDYLCFKNRFGQAV